MSAKIGNVGIFYNLSTPLSNVYENESEFHAEASIQAQYSSTGFRCKTFNSIEIIFFFLRMGATAKEPYI